MALSMQGQGPQEEARISNMLAYAVVHIAETNEILLSVKDSIQSEPNVLEKATKAEIGPADVFEQFRVLHRLIETNNAIVRDIKRLV
jgi:hypothetical protein